MSCGLCCVCLSDSDHGCSRCYPSVNSMCIVVVNIPLLCNKCTVVYVLFVLILCQCEA